MRILIPHTRELCYYSGSFFLDQIGNELSELGADVVRMDITDDDYSGMEEALRETFDAIIDINSKLPRLIDDQGRCYLNTIDTPLYNYILDHPLYHHQGLSVKAEMYHAIGVDEYHCSYMKRWYPHLKTISCIPMGGTKAIEPLPLSSREHEFLFSGTYFLPEVLEERAFRVRSDFGDATYRLMQDLCDAWQPWEKPIETALYDILSDYSGVSGGDVALYVNDYYEARDMAELLNRLYIVDQMRRNEYRYDVLAAAARTGYRLSLLGEGWEHTDISGYPSVRLLKPVNMELSFEIMANAKFIIDVNPFFFCGMHDRVTSALANKCVCITDMSQSFDRELRDGKEIFYYGHGRPAIAEVMGRAGAMDDEKLLEIAKGGHERWRGTYTWSAHAERLFELIKKDV